MTHRRSVLASISALLATTAGCNNTQPETTTQKTTQSTTTTTDTRSDTTTRTTSPGERHTQPELNQTQYDVIWQWDSGKPALPDRGEPTVALVTKSNWEIGRAHV